MPQLFAGMLTKIKILFKNRFTRTILLPVLAIIVFFPLFDRFVIYPSFTRLLIDDTKIEAQRLAKHVVASLGLEKMGLLGDPLSEDFFYEIGRIEKDFSLMKVKLFSGSGKAIYSTIPEEVGKIVHKPYFHDILSKGKTRTNVLRKDSKSSEGEPVTAEVVETYVPIMRNGEFVGVFEIYYDITARRNALDKLFFRSSAAIFTVSFFLVVAFSTLSFQVAKTEESLRKAHDELEIRVKRRTAELQAANKQLQREMAERKRVEQELIRAEKFSSLGVLSSGAAHEINNPLNAITLNLQAILKDELLKPEHRQACQDMTGAVDDILEVVAGLDYFAQQMKAEKHPVPILEELERAVRNIQGKALKRGIAVNVDFSPASPMVIGNPQLLRGSFEKVLDNAMRAMPSEGTLTIQVREVTHNGEKWARVNITDTGVGIVSDDLSKVFDPFYTTREVGEGKGLGLSTVLGIITEHGGSISAESNEGEGTTFTIMLPLLKKENDYG